MNFLTSKKKKIHNNNHKSLVLEDRREISKSKVEMSSFELITPDISSTFNVDELFSKSRNSIITSTLTRQPKVELEKSFSDRKESLPNAVNVEYGKSKYDHSCEFICNSCIYKRTVFDFHQKNKEEELTNFFQIIQKLNKYNNICKNIKRNDICLIYWDNKFYYINRENEIIKELEVIECLNMSGGKICISKIFVLFKDTLRYIPDVEGDVNDFLTDLELFPTYVEKTSIVGFNENIKKEVSDFVKRESITITNDNLVNTCDGTWMEIMSQYIPSFLYSLIENVIYDGQDYVIFFDLNINEIIILLENPPRYLNYYRRFSTDNNCVIVSKLTDRSKRYLKKNCISDFIIITPRTIIRS